jgi:flagellar motor switch/type III secretory pathway protein FliN
VTVALATRLRRVDPVEAAAQTRLIGALHRRLVGAWRLSACVVQEDGIGADTGWLRFAGPNGPVAVAPLVVDGIPVSPERMSDALNAAALLGPLEPFLGALEAVLGGALRPIGLDRDGSGGQVVLRLDADAAGQMVAGVLVAVPPATPVAADPLAALPLDPAALAHMPVAWRATITGPVLRLGRAARLARGDMVLLGIAPLRAELRLGRRHRSAHIDFNQGKLIVQEDATLPAGDIPHEDADPTDLPVRLTFAFDGGHVSAGELATLNAGSVLPLPTSGETLAVRILSGSAAIGTGELVAIGDGFGVIVTQRHGDR